MIVKPVFLCSTYGTCVIQSVFGLRSTPSPSVLRGHPHPQCPSPGAAAAYLSPRPASLVSSQHRQPTVTPTYSIDHHAPDFFSRFLQLQGWLRQNNAHVQLCLRPRRKQPRPQRHDVGLLGDWRHINAGPWRIHRHFGARRQRQSYGRRLLFQKHGNNRRVGCRRRCGAQKQMSSCGRALLAPSNIAKTS